MDVNALFDLRGKVAVVTGSSKGLGRSFAEALAGVGADLVVNSRHETDLQEVADTIRGMGRNVLCVQADITREGEVKELANKTLKRYGKIDVFVNNAATERVNLPPEKTSLESWSAVINTNVNGAFLCCREIGQVMIRQGRGKVINLASICGPFVIKGTHAGSYDVSKAAIAGLTKSVGLRVGSVQHQRQRRRPGVLQHPGEQEVVRREPGLLRGHPGQDPPAQAR